MFLILVSSLYCKSTLYYIHIYSDKYNVDHRVIQALIDVESNGKLNALSNKGAIGITQVMLQTVRDYYLYKHRKYGYKWAWIWYKSPDKVLRNHAKLQHINIQICCWKLRQLLNHYNDNYLMALNAYLHGITGSKNKTAWGYLNKIIDNMVAFK